MPKKNKNKRKVLKKKKTQNNINIEKELVFKIKPEWIKNALINNPTIYIL